MPQGLTEVKIQDTPHTRDKKKNQQKTKNVANSLTSTIPHVVEDNTTFILIYHLQIQES